MELKEEDLGEITVLEIRGRLDSNTAPLLGERLTGILTVPSRRLVLDMRDLEYISSAGFRVLLLAAKRADEAAARMVLCRLSGKVFQLFDLSGLLELFAIASSRDDAFAAIR